jgi:hypothetical protein
MRSRLEATVAAWMDAHKWQWDYEPRAYAASGQRQYLPDFEISKLEDDRPLGRPFFMEVRPTIEGAYRAMAQMMVIRASKPQAVLLVTAWPLGLMWMKTPENDLWQLIAWTSNHFP